ncbi:dTDP-4-dehydrorhamnose 3,5-epimerase [Chthonobacter albigriseus]|uniref:dTDP-4-dehydrorhamnose 3,5-epimerase n=1 Tax=Chthonobacter albigriseus TaxID=1683161 RepID=UPI0015EE5C7F|nr:dTDP-4-dehydrorhamnose 3,5-epimerase [Chthonobacter albigriseus]
MRMQKLAIEGAFLIEASPIGDERGFFARSWCDRVFREAGVTFEVMQTNISRTQQKGTIRGMHFQRAPQRDGKVVRCFRGTVYDVIADMRPESPTFRAWQAVLLSERNLRSLYLPPGCAQGFQSLEDDVVVHYMMGAFYNPNLYDGFCYDDPAVGIEWPLPVSCLSDRDKSWERLVERCPRTNMIAPDGTVDFDYCI